MIVCSHMVDEAFHTYSLVHLFGNVESAKRQLVYTVRLKYPTTSAARILG